MVVVDTNIIIDHLRQKAPNDSIFSKILARTKPDDLAISTITIQELFTGQSTKDKEIEKLILAILLPVNILSYTYEVAKMAGEITRDLNRPIELADVAIAATAILNECEFATLNKKHFEGIKDLEFLDL